MNLAAILQLAVGAEPGIINLIQIIRSQGTTTVIASLDAADTSFTTNQQQITDWFTSKGKPSPAAAQVPPPVPVKL